MSLQATRVDLCLEELSAAQSRGAEARRGANEDLLYGLTDAKWQPIDFSLIQLELERVSCARFCTL